MKQPIKKPIEETDEGKAIIKSFLDGMPYNEIVELAEYSLIEFWLGEIYASTWLEMLECTNPSELEKYLEEED